LEEKGKILGRNLMNMPKRMIDPIRNKKNARWKANFKP